VAQIDIFPTIAQITKMRLTESAKAQIKGKSFMPLLQNQKSDWENRLLFTHVGRWPNGADPNLHQYQNCAVRDQRYSLVNNKELYDLKNDLAQKHNIIAEHPAITARLKAGYDAWWKSLDKSFVNESAYLTAPKKNAFKELWEKQQ
jgi:arylsulfatase